MSHQRRLSDESKAIHEGVMRGSPTLEAVSDALRKGYIMGQHAYEAGLRQCHKHITGLNVKRGFDMGWQGRFADEMAGLEATPIGTQGGCKVADDVWQQR